MNNASLFVKGNVEKVTTTLTPEIDCDQTAMGLAPLTPAVLLITK
jgi:hypothetical protein